MDQSWAKVGGGQPADIGDDGLQFIDRYFNRLATFFAILMVAGFVVLDFVL